MNDITESRLKEEIAQLKQACEHWHREAEKNYNRWQKEVAKITEIRHILHYNLNQNIDMPYITVREIQNVIEKGDKSENG